VRFTRFAPSPTGLIHLGHVYAARVASQLARAISGGFLLRFEDIDHTRIRPEFYEACRDDLAFLDLTADREVTPQLERVEAYHQALESLRSLDVLYPCFCTRKEIQAELAGMTTAPHGPDGALYPGTCRRLTKGEIDQRLGQGDIPAWRLHSERAARIVGKLRFVDMIHGEFEVAPGLHGDVILARRDIGTSYHLAVTVDDAHDGISHVTRGDDLLAATHIHRTLQSLLGITEPTYVHHRLVLGPDGKRLAKRDQPTSIQELRTRGMSRDEILGMLPPLPTICAS
jgi:glutamyl-Q tRNA(Asp) synthetase